MVRVERSVASKAHASLQKLLPPFTTASPSIGSLQCAHRTVLFTFDHPFVLSRLALLSTENRAV